MPEANTAVFRAHTWFAIFCVFYGFIFLLTAGAALNPDVPLAGRLASGAIAAGIVYMGWISWRAGVEVNAEHVVVRRCSGRNAVVPWSQVQDFALVPNGRGGAWIAVQTTDGRQLKTQGLAVNSAKSAWGQSVIAQLEASRPQA